MTARRAGTRPPIARTLRPLAAALLAALTWLPAGAATTLPPDPEWHIARSGDPTEPGHAEYAALRAAYAAALERADTAEPPAVTAGTALRAGMRDPRVAALRARLRHSGDYAAEAGADPWYFEAALDAALRRLQRRHTLIPDGVLGERTLAAVNRSAAGIAEQLAVALERWRWLPRDLGDAYVWVNIPRAQLDVVEAGRVTLTMRVVVGHRDRPTPSLAGRLNRAVFNPTWSVPDRIATEDLLPRQQADAGFLARNGFQAFDGRGRRLDLERIDWSALQSGRRAIRLVQSAGPDNSLGRIKLSFDNPYDIYLHDTPVRGLFGLMTRSLSSGCVRLEDAPALATLLLGRERRWTAAETTAAIDSAATRTINLATGLPVWLVYITAWTEDGELRLGRDLYGRDTAVAAALRHATATANLQP